MASYEYRHLVLFEETNALGNVYYVNHLRWQGRCREAFLRDHAPDIAERLGRDLLFVTTRCSCEYLAELSPFDEVTVRMTLNRVIQNRLLLHFEYWRCRKAEGEDLVAAGEQEIALMRREGERICAAALPPTLLSAMQPYVRVHRNSKSRVTVSSALG